MLLLLLKSVKNRIQFLIIILILKLNKLKFFNVNKYCVIFLTKY